ncbi:GntR family transcriptional regulator [Eubacteriales bacterium OttesenSCG-928-A19]|nr:GntR family transcriptional regulator [Eubacteriales bacterium OttesenSCG-928-A19]
MEELFQDLSNSQTLKDKVYLNLRELIISGKIKPGSRLPEEELSKQMNISRAPIREALNMLEREGFTTIIPRKGAIVTEVTPELARDIWEMRRVLEPYAARTSMAAIPKSEIIRIDGLVKQTIEHPDNLDLYVTCDLELHEMLYKYGTNRYLKDYIATTVGHSLRVRYFVEYNESLSEAAVADVYQEHSEIMDALKAQDADMLHAKVLHHVSNSLLRCESALDGNEKV